MVDEVFISGHPIRTHVRCPHSIPLVLPVSLPVRITARTRTISKAGSSEVTEPSSSALRNTFQAN